MMQHFSLSCSPPTAPPFDRPVPQPGNWYDSFLGNIVLPLSETGKLDRFWFSQYGAFGKGHHAKFRFSTEHSDEVHAILNPLIVKFSIQLLQEHGETYPHQFDIIGDLVSPQEKRHFGDNARNTSRLERGECLYTFLHAASALTLHCLSHSDSESRWYREVNPDRVNTQFGDTTEAIHHLFCNLSSVPTAVCVVPMAGQIGPPYQLASPLYAKIAGILSQGTAVIPVMF